MQNLFKPLTLGNHTLANRIIMAPLTRGRAEDDGTPTKLMAEYYQQRATSGLIVAEATAIRYDGRGWMNSPALYNEQHVNGWSEISKRVHEKGGKIFVQLWHMGATVHPDFLGGSQPVSASNIRLDGALTTPKGRDKQFVEPRALTQDEIAILVNDFADSAALALKAGLDGVEIHAANGFLIDQFTRDGTNKREDHYGGSIANRIRFLKEVVTEVSKRVGAGNVGVRISPTNTIWGISDSDYHETFTEVAKMLNDFGLAYLHILEPKPNSGHAMETVDYITPIIRKVYKGNLLVNGGYSQESAEVALKEQVGDGIVFGSPFIANPDLVARFQNDYPLSELDPNTLYTRGERGYTDYSAYE